MKLCFISAFICYLLDSLKSYFSSPKPGTEPPQKPCAHSSALKFVTFKCCHNKKNILQWHWKLGEGLSFVYQVGSCVKWSNWLRKSSSKIFSHSELTIYTTNHPHIHNYQPAFFSCLQKFINIRASFFFFVLLGGILIISSVYIVETVFLKKASKMQFLYVFLYFILHPEELFGHGNLMPLSPFYTVSLC